MSQWGMMLVCLKYIKFGVILCTLQNRDGVSYNLPNDQEIDIIRPIIIMETNIE